MAKSKEVLINVTVQATDGINTLNQVNKSLENGAKAASDMGSAVNQALQPIKGSVADLQSQVNALEKARLATATTSAEYKKQGIEIDKLNVKISELSGARGLGSVNSAAGIAGATVNEFGRFVSDLPFGIVAVTNNLSQMGSLFGILVAQAAQLQNGLSTTRNVLNLLSAQFLGPAGILFVFQAAVTALTLFAQRSKESESALKGLSTTLKEQSTIVKDLLDQYLRLNDAQSGRSAVLNQLKKIDEDLYNALKDNNKTEQEKAEIIERYNKLTDLTIEKELKYGKILDERVVLQGEIRDLDAKILETRNQEAKSSDEKTAKDIKLNALIEDKNELLEKDGELSKQILDINKQLITAEDDLSTSIGVTNEELKKRTDLTRDYLSQLRSSRIELLEAEEGGTEEEQVDRLEKIKKLQEEELKIREEAAIEKAIQDGIFFDLDNELFQTFANERRLLELDHQKKLLDIRASFNQPLDPKSSPLTKFFADENQKIRVFLNDNEQDTLKAFKQTNDKILTGLAQYMAKRKEIEENGAKATQDLEDKRFERQVMAIRVAQDLANGIFDIANTEFDKEMTLEQNKTVELNNQLKERLRNESLSADERKSIQNQIAQNDEALRKKQEAIEEKRFKLNKAASIANAVVNTYLAAATALKNFGGVPTGIPAMVATIATGLAQVAVIAKQRFVKSDAGGSPGISTSTASTPMAIQAPAFNVVGQSGATQLADVVSGQLNRPLKTYVVAKDVTTAQELDRNRVSAASI
jgi:hypothetical protein